MQPCKAAYKNCSQKSINFEKLCWVFLKIDGFPLEILSPNIPNSTDFASKSQISDEINSCSFCMCILRCFSERASKQHTTKGSSKRNKKCQSGPQKSTYFASYSQISNEGNSGVYLGTTLVPNLDDFLGGKLEKGFSPQCIFKLLLKWP